MLEFFERAYYHEFERKDKIVNGTNLPITVIAALYGGLFYIADNFISELESVGLIEVLFLCSFVLSVLLIVFSSYYFAHVIHSVYYEYLDEPKSLKDYHDELVRFYEKSGKGENSTWHL
ncbi:hypothetical protein [Parvibaculum sp.]|uniref:hypothetical protein n=1 Tax=Parvibaculum sp. TaxID=2024848 RepID=UPI001DEF99AC|nr:hypothetical protein [Parvibaculum sp.]MBX3491006.1 hypothetical protein [Parvibaculum sp.]